MITLTHYMILSAILFTMSLIGIVMNRRHLIVMLLCIELMLLAVNTNLVAISQFFHQTVGEIFVFFILTVAAAESAIGLAILVLLYRQRQSIDVDAINQLKG